MEIYYQEDADYLEIFFKDPCKDYGEDIGEGITIFKDAKTNGLYGLAILGFKSRTKDLKEVSIDLSKYLKIIDKP